MTLESLVPLRHAPLFGEANSSVIPRPPSRWKTRVLTPVAVLFATVGLLVYSARSTLIPETDVWVVPVVAVYRGGSLPAESVIPGHKTGDDSTDFLAQAPGWIEPEPYSVLVAALADGVIHEILVLEGERVEAGQIVARMIDVDANLAVETADAQLAAMQASEIKSQADVRAQEARLAEFDDQVARLRKLAETGAVPEGQLAQFQFRLMAAQEELAAAQASADLARANVQAQEVACKQARLALSRMEIASPLSGVVMTRFVEPGSRVSMNKPGRGSASESMNGAILRLYDPAKLQVRVDVTLADCAKVRIGSRAEVVTEAAPDAIFRGVVSRIVHEANIQRNTLQVKVSIQDAADALKPEMLARVRFYSGPASTKALATHQGSDPSAIGSDSHSLMEMQGRSDLRLVIPERALLDRNADKARVWVVENNARDQLAVAAERMIRAELRSFSGTTAVIEGLHPGDRVIVDPPASLRRGSRVRVVGETPEGQAVRKGEGS